MKSEDGKGFKRKMARRTKSSPRKHFNQQQMQQVVQQQQQQQQQPQQQLQQQSPVQQQQQQQQQPPQNPVVSNDGYTLNHDMANTSANYTNSSGAGAGSDNFKVKKFKQI